VTEESWAVNKTGMRDEGCGRGFCDNLRPLAHPPRPTPHPRWIAIGVIFYLLIGGTAAAGITQHILSRIEELSLPVRSYKANYDLTLRLKGDEIRMKGILLYKWPEQIRNDMAVDDTRGLRQIIYWKNGILWQYLPDSKVAFRQEEAKLRGEYPDIFATQDLLNLRSPFDLVEIGSVRFLEEERGEGAEAFYLLEGIPKKALQAQGVLSPQLCRFRISSQDGLLRDFIMYDENGEEIYKQHIWELQANLDLLDEEFEFRLPEDVELVEVTQENEKRLAALAKGEEAE